MFSNHFTASFSEIFEQYNVLHKHDVEILEEMSLKLKNLNKEWNDYCHELEDTEFALKKIKVFTFYYISLKTDIFQCGSKESF